MVKSYPLVFLLAPHRALTFVQRQHVDSITAPLFSQALAEGWALVSPSQWSENPDAAAGEHPWEHYVVSLLLRCDRVFYLQIPGVPDDPLTKQVLTVAAQHGIVVHTRSLQ